MIEFLTLLVSLPPSATAILIVGYMHFQIARLKRDQIKMGSQVSAITKYMGIEIASGSHVVKTDGRTKKLHGYILLFFGCFAAMSCATVARHQGYIGDQKIDITSDGTTTVDPKVVAAVAAAVAEGAANATPIGGIVAGVAGVATAIAGAVGYASERSRRKFHESDADDAYKQLQEKFKPYKATDKEA